MFAFLLATFLSILPSGDDKGVSMFFSEADMFFKKHIQTRSVDYKAITKKPEQLMKLVSTIAAFDLENADGKTEMAFWINAYNILVIQSVVNNYPLKSPLDVQGFFDTQKHPAAGEKLTLNEIENKKLREKFGDARIHFVLVCAAQSCPPIIDEAYLPSKLDKQLDDRTKMNLTDDTFLQVDSKSKKVAISEIFKWYKADFAAGENTVLQYINQFRKEKIPEDYDVGFYQYDWNLNEKKISLPASK